MKKIRLIIGMLVFVLGISNSSLSIFAAELDNENEQKIVSEIGTALQQDVQEEWDGLTVLHPNMAAECREQQM